MKKNRKTKKVIACLLMLIFVVAAVALAEYAMLSRSYEENRKLRIAQENNEQGENLAAVENKENESLDGIKVHGQLLVKGTQLTDASGNPVQLRGMSSHGILWYPEYSNFASLCETKKYGANMFRIAMYADDVDDGYVQQPTLSKKLVCQAIENALAADMYVIVDWHTLKEENPLKNVLQAKEFFEEISTRYAKEPGILYEICNEPNGDTSWEQIREYAEQVIPVIREHAPDAVILVGTPDYSYSITKVEPLSYENLMYSYHFYAGQYDDAYKNMIEDTQRKGIPVFVTEWGINEEQGGEAALTQGKAFAEYLNEKKISFAAWSLCNKEETFSALRPDCGTYRDWAEKDFTEVGRILFEALKG